MRTVSESRIFYCWRRFALLSAVLVLASLLPVALLEWSRTEIQGGDYWRLITGHWVHLGPTHLLLNLAGLLVTGLLFTRQPPLAWWLSYLILAPLAISSGLLITAPELAWYRGFSGCLHGLLVFTALFNFRSDTRWSLIILGFIALKLAFENVLYPAAGHNPLIGGAVVTHAHWLGALTGLVAGVLLLLREFTRPAVRE